ncbi:alpha/beta fold hydrolase [Rhodoferax bucti]|uniref:alpha/beta fold hydrolase n=1 Tax=Rhodoferax bucti TaxID=2576305 RepID=UPI001F0E200A|nr:alpha/beta hydrolase [Rhodoferax bucti]
MKIHLQRRWLVAGLASLLVGCLAPAWAQPKPCAMLLMHGKWGHPNNLAAFDRQMEPACDTQSIEMPWSRRRNYDQPYPVAIAEIAAHVKALHDKGYARVLLAGHSFGANAALAYMATHADADGVIALAPGHSPAFTYGKGIGKAAVDQARQMVAEGKGTDMLDMEDFNQGKSRPVRMRADVLLSYFDPEGLGHMPQSASMFKKAVPFLWVIGTKDPLYPAGPSYAFEKAPAHPASQYLVVEADHLGTPEVAAPQVLAWVRALP